MEADFPTLMGKGGHDRGEFRILEVGEAPCEHTIPEAPFRLGPLVEHEKRGPDSRAAFQDDPHHYAAEYGFQDLSAADVHDALCLIADNASWFAAPFAAPPPDAKR